MPTTIGFSVLDHHLVFDANSNLLFFVPEEVKNVVNDVAQGIDKTKISQKYENGEAILQEIDLLKEDGKLFAEELPLPNLYGEEPFIVKSMCLNVSHDCDMRCGYCFAGMGDYHGERRLMTLETGRAVVDFLIKNSGNRKKLDVDFFGGEPMMNYPVVKGMILYMMEEGKKHDKQFKITVTTNSFDLSEEQKEFLNSLPINLVLSLDGREKVHDRVRKDRDGKGTQERIVNNIKDLTKNRDDLSYFVRGTYTHHSLDFDKDVKYMADEGMKNLSMEPVVLQDGHALAITKEDLPEIFDSYDRLAELYLDYGQKGDKSFHFFHFNLDLDHGPCVHKRISGCGAGSEYLAVSPEGNLYPCHQFVGDADYIIGNIYDGIHNEEMRRTFKNTHVYTKDVCIDCFAKFLCSGGCHASAIYQNGDIKKPYAIGCEIQKKRLQCALFVSAIQKIKEQSES